MCIVCTEDDNTRKKEEKRKRGGREGMMSEGIEGIGHRRGSTWVLLVLLVDLFAHFPARPLPISLFGHIPANTIGPAFACCLFCPITFSLGLARPSNKRTTSLLVPGHITSTPEPNSLIPRGSTLAI